MAKTESVSKSGLATAGLVIGIIAVLLSAVPIINNFAALLAVFALIFGIIGLVQTKKGRRKNRGVAISGTVLAVVALVVVFASQAFYGAALDSAGKEFNKSMDTATGKNTDQLLKTDVSIELGTFSATTDQYGLNTTELPITVTNKNKEKKSYSIKIEAVDASGSRLAEDTLYVNDLGSGQSQKDAVFKYVESGKLEALKTATFKIATVSQT